MADAGQHGVGFRYAGRTAPASTCCDRRCFDKDYIAVHESGPSDYSVGFRHTRRLLQATPFCYLSSCNTKDRRLLAPGTSQHVLGVSPSALARLAATGCAICCFHCEGLARVRCAGAGEHGVGFLSTRGGRHAAACCYLGCGPTAFAAFHRSRTRERCMGLRNTGAQ